MATDDRTPTQNFPRPHINNTIAEDFARVIALVNMLDAKISAMDGQVSGKAVSGHTHAIAGIDGLQGALDAKQSASWRPALGELSNVNVAGVASGQFLGLVGTTWQPVTLSVAWGNVSGKPASYPTTWADITEKPTTFAPSTHGHSTSEIAGLTDALNWLTGFAGKMLPSTGGRMTGSLQIDSAYPFLHLNKSASGGAALLRGMTNGNIRWQIKLGDETAETGGDQGSNFAIESVSDGGTYIGRFWINRASGDVNIGKTRVHGADGSLELGVNGAGDRPSYVDFHAHGGPWATDYAARILRNPGVNGSFEIVNTGSGGIALVPAPGAPVQMGRPGDGNFAFVARQNNGVEGGELRLEKPATGSSLAGDLAIDVYGNQFRVFEAGGGARGVHVDIAACAGGAGSQLTHIHNIGWHIAALAPEAVGSLGFFRRNGNAAYLPGDTCAGSELQWPNTGLAYAHSPVGTWMCLGASSGIVTSHATLYKRVA